MTHPKTPDDMREKIVLLVTLAYLRTDKSPDPNLHLMTPSALVQSVSDEITNLIDSRLKSVLTRILRKLPSERRRPNYVKPYATSDGDISNIYGEDYETDGFNEALKKVRLVITAELTKLEKSDDSKRAN